MTSEVQPPRSFHFVPSWFHPQMPLFTHLAKSYSSCQFLLCFRGLVQQHNFTASSNPTSEVGLPTRFPPKEASQHFHQHIFPLAPTFSLIFSILRESWLLRSAVTTPIEANTDNTLTCASDVRIGPSAATADNNRL